MYEWDNDESEWCEYGIDYSDEWLSSENSSESTRYLVSDDRVLSIEKCKIPILYLSKKSSNRLTLDHEYVWEYESDEELGQYDPSIAEVSEHRLSYCLEIIRIDDIADDLIQTEWDRELLLDTRHKYLDLARHLWSSLDELPDLYDDLWDDIDKEKYDNNYEYNIENTYHYIGTIVPEGEFCCFISFFVYTPCMDDPRYPWSYLEK